ncbi:MAG: NUDIX domain-containing protein [Holosporales bacterium]|jgi:8-oxo-dGTP pyrophosphatase MutT (NUDIX family)|nr:NUDIX domain-containing protein [Holosporales bacterium]
MKIRAVLKCAAYLILEEDGRVLLQQRQGSGFFDGYWGLPSGHWEYGESLSQTVIREAKEEVNIDIELRDLTLKLVLKSFPDDYVGLFFAARKYSGAIKITNRKNVQDYVSFLFMICQAMSYLIFLWRFVQ